MDPMYEDLCLYIDGQFLKGDGRKEQDVVNPATDEVIGKLPHASKADLDRALAAAQRAFQTWRKSSPMERSRILRKVAELSRARAKEIGANITQDMGKPLAEAMGEVTVCSEHAVTSPTASASGLPMSSVMLAPISLARARESSATLRRMRLRSMGEDLRQVRKAFCAAASAPSRSAFDACGSFPITSSVAGLTTSCSLRPSPLRNWPLM